MKYHHYRVNQNYAFSVSERKEDAYRDVEIFENGKTKEKYEHYDHFGLVTPIKNDITQYIKQKYINKKQEKTQEQEIER